MTTPVQDQPSVARPPRNLGSRLAGAAVLALLVASGLLLFGDARRVPAVLGGFDWRLLAPVLALTLWNYGLRFLKWQLYLRQLGIGGLSTGRSALIFLSAFSMSITPGKVGEVIKCSELRRATGTPLSRSTAIVVAERLTDGLAMVVLAGVGLLQFAAGRTVVGLAAIAAGGAIILLRRPRAVAALLARLPPRPLLDRLRLHADDFLATAGELVRPRLLVVGTAIGVVAWLGECAALFLILVGFDLTPTAALLLVAIFTLAVASLAGALSLLPGGLGVAEASVAGMLLLLVRDDAMDRGVSAATTLLIRFATLWFAVLLGVAALLLVRRRSTPSRPRLSAAGVDQGEDDPLIEQRETTGDVTRRGGGDR